MERPLVIFGTGEIADVAHFYFTRDSGRKVAAFTCDPGYIAASTLHNLPVVPFDAIERQYPADAYDMFIAIGYSGLNAVRRQKYLEAKARGYRLASYISSRAIVWEGTPIGDNCFIMELNNIQPYAAIGSNVVLWSGNHIGHHSVIGDHCFLASHVVVSGGVRVGERCFLGVNATIRDHIAIADACVIGAGAYISADTEPGRVYPGHPARAMPGSSEEAKI